MWNKIEDWLLNKFAGKLLARAGVTIAAWLASEKVKALLSAYGLSINIEPAEFSAGVIALGHAAYEWYKAWRLKKNAPAQPPAA